MDQPDSLRHSALDAISASNSLQALEEIRVAWLGKKGKITEALKTLGGLSPEERKARGAELNALKDEIAAAIEAKKELLAAAALEARLKEEALDMTLPARPENRGRIHPVTQAIEEITAIFAQLGFTVEEGPDIEDDAHNFTALNIPESHPARQMHDTFYLGSGLEAQGLGDMPASSLKPQASSLLRTHTSPVQIRTMRQGNPPFRVLAPGSTYRCDSDQTHTPMFHQVEGFVIDKGIHMGHLKGCVEEFLRVFFGLHHMQSISHLVRFRPSFFPFTEPSAEVDIMPHSENLSKMGKWLEVMGCGMVHPNVLNNCGINPEEWQGFAFGMGVERLAMLKYGIADLRDFFSSDARWLRHYGFAPIPAGIGA